MLGNLISAIMLTTAIGIGGPLNTSTDYQDVNVTETYEYETNEVNSVDDLVVGNIYKIDFDLSQYQNAEYLLQSNTYIKIETNEYLATKIESLGVNPLNLYIRPSSSSIVLIENTTSSWLVVLSEIDFTQEISVYFIYLNASYIYGTNLPYASDYLGEKTVTVTDISTDGLYETFYYFINTRIFSGGMMDTIQMEILGTTMTLGNWLSVTATAFILCLILYMLIRLVIWMFKQVSNTF